jgi:transposase
MYSVHLSKQERQDLQKRLAREQNSKIWKRLQAIYSRSRGITSREIAKNLSVSLNTVTAWVKLYLTGGVETLVALNYTGPVSKLEPYRQEIENLIQTETIPTLNVLQQRVKQEFEVEIGETGLYKWCKKKLMLPLRRPE